MGLFGPEKIMLALEQFNFYPGEKIKGTISLNLKKPTKARKFEVGLFGTRKEVRRKHDGRTETKHVKVYDFTIPLGQEGEYQKGDFTFEIPIPEDILMIGTRQRPEGTLGAVADVMGALGGQRQYPIEWSIKAQLDVPMKLDVKKSQKIVIA